MSRARTRRMKKTFVWMLLGSASVIACSGWDPARPFEREAPEVREAIGVLDGGDARISRDLLAEYLATGQCREGNIGTPTRVRERSNGSFDLGLALFKVAEAFGRRFGDEENDAGVSDPVLKQQRVEQIDCALRIVRAVATDPSQPLDLRARARYLEGNLLFLNTQYEDAVRAYDAALELAPGMHDSGPIATNDSGRTYTPDLVGRDAAWNRAIALRRIEDKKDAGQDSGSDAANDSGNDGSSGDSGKNENGDGGGNNQPDGGKDSGSNDKDAGADSGENDDNKNEPPKPSPDDKKDAGQPPPQSRQNQDERMLDQLENAPTVQQEAAKKERGRRRVRGMNDK